jgi:hypothetical protein
MSHPQVCDHCGGRFGMVSHRWWGNKFCKTTCKDAYLREFALGRDKIRRWYGFVPGGWFRPSAIADSRRSNVPVLEAQNHVGGRTLTPTSATAR